MTSGVYWIYRKPGHVYVGSSVDIAKRWRDHRRQLDTGKHRNPRLQNAWNKYGAEAFQWVELETVPHIDGETTADFKARLLGVEQFWIDATGAAVGSGYNVCEIAGSTLGNPTSPKTRAKMSAAKKGKPKSPETKAKMSAARKGKPLSAAQIAAYDARKGKPLSAAQIAANEARKGKPNPKLSVAMKGKPNPAVAERNRARKGKPLSAAQIAARKGKPLSAAQIAAYDASKGKTLSLESVAKRTATRAANRLLAQGQAA